MKWKRNNDDRIHYYIRKVLFNLKASRPCIMDDHHELNGVRKTDTEEPQVFSAHNKGPLFFEAGIHTSNTSAYMFRELLYTTMLSR